MVAIRPADPDAGYVAGSSGVFISVSWVRAKLRCSQRWHHGHSPRELTVKPADVTMTYGGSAELTVEYINLAPGETEADLGGTVRLHYR